MAVKLKSSHLEDLIDITQNIIDYKSRALRQSTWNKFETEYLPSLVEQLRNNEFTCHRPDDSTFTWIIDQVCHSRKLVEGVPHSQGLPLCDTTLGQRVLDICRNATRGQKHYDTWSSNNKFNDLFQ